MKFNNLIKFNFLKFMKLIKSYGVYNLKLFQYNKINNSYQDFIHSLSNNSLNLTKNISNSSSITKNKIQFFINSLNSSFYSSDSSTTSHSSSYILTPNDTLYSHAIQLFYSKHQQEKYANVFSTSNLLVYFHTNNFNLNDYNINNLASISTSTTSSNFSSVEDCSSIFIVLLNTNIELPFNYDLTRGGENYKEMTLVTLTTLINYVNEIIKNLIILIVIINNYLINFLIKLKNLLKFNYNELLITYSFFIQQNSTYFHNLNDTFTLSSSDSSSSPILLSDYNNKKKEILSLNISGLLQSVYNFYNSNNLKQFFLLNNINSNNTTSNLNSSYYFIITPADSESSTSTSFSSTCYTNNIIKEYEISSISLSSTPNSNNPSLVSKSFSLLSSNEIVLNLFGLNPTSTTTYSSSTLTSINTINNIESTTTSDIITIKNKNILSWLIELTNSNYLSSNLLPTSIKLIRTTVKYNDSYFILFSPLIHLNALLSESKESVIENIREGMSDNYYAKSDDSDNAEIDSDDIYENDEIEDNDQIIIENEEDNEDLLQDNFEINKESDENNKLFNDYLENSLSLIINNNRKNKLIIKLNNIIMNLQLQLHQDLLLLFINHFSNFLQQNDSIYKKLITQSLMKLQYNIINNNSLQYNEKPSVDSTPSLVLTSTSKKEIETNNLYNRIYELSKQFHLMNFHQFLNLKEISFLFSSNFNELYDNISEKNEILFYNYERQITFTINTQFEWFQDLLIGKTVFVTNISTYNSSISSSSSSSSSTLINILTQLSNYSLNAAIKLIEVNNFYVFIIFFDLYQSNLMNLLHNFSNPSSLPPINPISSHSSSFSHHPPQTSTTSSTTLSNSPSIIPFTSQFIEYLQNNNFFGIIKYLIEFLINNNLLNNLIVSSNNKIKKQDITINFLSLFNKKLMDKNYLINNFKQWKLIYNNKMLNNKYIEKNFYYEFLESILLFRINKLSFLTNTSQPNEAESDFGTDTNVIHKQFLYLVLNYVKKLFINDLVHLEIEKDTTLLTPSNSSLNSIAIKDYLLNSKSYSLSIPLVCYLLSTSSQPSANSINTSFASSSSYYKVIAHYHIERVSSASPDFNKTEKNELQKIIGLASNVYTSLFYGFHSKENIEMLMLNQLNSTSQTSTNQIDSSSLPLVNETKSNLILKINEKDKEIQNLIDSNNEKDSLINQLLSKIKKLEENNEELNERNKKLSNELDEKIKQENEVNSNLNNIYDLFNNSIPNITSILDQSISKSSEKIEVLKESLEEKISTINFDEMNNLIYSTSLSKSSLTSLPKNEEILLDSISNINQNLKEYLDAEMIVVKLNNSLLNNVNDRDETFVILNSEEKNVKNSDQTTNEVNRINSLNNLIQSSVELVNNSHENKIYSLKLKNINNKKENSNLLSFKLILNSNDNEKILVRNENKLNLLKYFYPLYFLLNKILVNNKQNNLNYLLINKLIELNQFNLHQKNLSEVSFNKKINLLNDKINFLMKFNSHLLSSLSLSSPTTFPTIESSLPATNNTHQISSPSSNCPLPIVSHLLSIKETLCNYFSRHVEITFYFPSSLLINENIKNYLEDLSKNNLLINDFDKMLYEFLSSYSIPSSSKKPLQDDLFLTINTDNKEINEMKLDLLLNYPIYSGFNLLNFTNLNTFPSNLIESLVLKDFNNTNNIYGVVLINFSNFLNEIHDSNEDSINLTQSTRKYSNKIYFHNIFNLNTIFISSNLLQVNNISDLLLVLFKSDENIENNEKNRLNCCYIISKLFSCIILPTLFNKLIYNNNELCLLNDQKNILELEKKIKNNDNKLVELNNIIINYEENKISNNQLINQLNVKLLKKNKINENNVNKILSLLNNIILLTENYSIDNRCDTYQNILLWLNELSNNFKCNFYLFSNNNKDYYDLPYPLSSISAIWPTASEAIRTMKSISIIVSTEKQDKKYTTTGSSSVSNDAILGENILYYELLFIPCRSSASVVQGQYNSKCFIFYRLLSSSISSNPNSSLTITSNTSSSEVKKESIDENENILTDEKLKIKNVNSTMNITNSNSISNAYLIDKVIKNEEKILLELACNITSRILYKSQQQILNEDIQLIKNNNELNKFNLLRVIKSVSIIENNFFNNQNIWKSKESMNLVIKSVITSLIQIDTNISNNHLISDKIDVETMIYNNDEIIKNLLIYLKLMKSNSFTSSFTSSTSASMSTPSTSFNHSPHVLDLLYHAIENNQKIVSKGTILILIFYLNNNTDKIDDNYFNINNNFNLKISCIIIIEKKIKYDELPSLSPLNSSYSTSNNSPVNQPNQKSSFSFQLNLSNDKSSATASSSINQTLLSDNLLINEIDKNIIQLFSYSINILLKYYNNLNDINDSLNEAANTIIIIQNKKNSLEKLIQNYKKERNLYEISMKNSYDFLLNSILISNNTNISLSKQSNLKNHKEEIKMNQNLYTNYFYLPNLINNFTNICKKLTNSDEAFLLLPQNFFYQFLLDTSSSLSSSSYQNLPYSTLKCFQFNKKTQPKVNDYCIYLTDKNEFLNIELNYQDLEYQSMDTEKSIFIPYSSSTNSSPSSSPSSSTSNESNETNLMSSFLRSFIFRYILDHLKDSLTLTSDLNPSILLVPFKLSSSLSSPPSSSPFSSSNPCNVNDFGVIVLLKNILTNPKKKNDENLTSISVGYNENERQCISYLSHSFSCSLLSSINNIYINHIINKNNKLETKNILNKNKIREFIQLYKQLNLQLPQGLLVNSEENKKNNEDNEISYDESLIYSYASGIKMVEFLIPKIIDVYINSLQQYSVKNLTNSIHNLSDKSDTKDTINLPPSINQLEVQLFEAFLTTIFDCQIRPIQPTTSPSLDKNKKKTKKSSLADSLNNMTWNSSSNLKREIITPSLGKIEFWISYSNKVVDNTVDLNDIDDEKEDKNDENVLKINQIFIKWTRFPFPQSNLATNITSTSNTSKENLSSPKISSVSTSSSLNTIQKALDMNAYYSNIPASSLKQLEYELCITNKDLLFNIFEIRLFFLEQWLEISWKWLKSSTILYYNSYKFITDGINANNDTVKYYKKCNDELNANRDKEKEQYLIRLNHKTKKIILLDNLYNTLTKSFNQFILFNTSSNSVNSSSINSPNSSPSISISNKSLKNEKHSFKLSSKNYVSLENEIFNLFHLLTSHFTSILNLSSLETKHGKVYSNGKIERLDSKADLEGGFSSPNTIWKLILNWTSTLISSNENVQEFKEDNTAIIDNVPNSETVEQNNLDDEFNLYHNEIQFKQLIGSNNCGKILICIDDKDKQSRSEIRRFCNEFISNSSSEYPLNNAIQLNSSNNNFKLFNDLELSIISPFTGYSHGSLIFFYTSPLSYSINLITVSTSENDFTPTYQDESPYNKPSMSVSYIEINDSISMAISPPPAPPLSNILPASVINDEVKDSKVNFNTSSSLSNSSSNSLTLSLLLNYYIKAFNFVFFYYSNIIKNDIKNNNQSIQIYNLNHNKKELLIKLILLQNKFNFGQKLNIFNSLKINSLSKLLRSTQESNNNLKINNNNLNLSYQEIKASYNKLENHHNRLINLLEKQLIDNKVLIKTLLNSHSLYNILSFNSGLLGSNISSHLTLNTSSPASLVWSLTCDTILAILRGECTINSCSLIVFEENELVEWVVRNNSSTPFKSDENISNNINIKLEKKLTKDLGKKINQLLYDLLYNINEDNIINIQQIYKITKSSSLESCTYLIPIKTIKEVIGVLKVSIKIPLQFNSSKDVISSSFPHLSSSSPDKESSPLNSPAPTKFSSPLPHSILFNDLKSPKTPLKNDYNYSYNDNSLNSLTSLEEILIIFENNLIISSELLAPLLIISSNSIEKSTKLLSTKKKLLDTTNRLSQNQLLLQCNKNILSILYEETNYLTKELNSDNYNDNIDEDNIDNLNFSIYLEKIVAKFNNILTNILKVETIIKINEDNLLRSLNIDSKYFNSTLSPSSLNIEPHSNSSTLFEEYNILTPLGISIGKLIIKNINNNEHEKSLSPLDSSSTSNLPSTQNILSLCSFISSTLISLVLLHYSSINRNKSFLKYANQLEINKKLTQKNNNLLAKLDLNLLNNKNFILFNNILLNSLQFLTKDHQFLLLNANQHQNQVFNPPIFDLDESNVSSSPDSSGFFSINDEFSPPKLDEKKKVKVERDQLQNLIPNSLYYHFPECIYYLNSFIQNIKHIISLNSPPSNSSSSTQLIKTSPLFVLCLKDYSISSPFNPTTVTSNKKTPKRLIWLTSEGQLLTESGHIFNINQNNIRENSSPSLNESINSLSWSSLSPASKAIVFQLSNTALKQETKMNIEINQKKDETIHDVLSYPSLQLQLTAYPLFHTESKEVIGSLQILDPVKSSSSNFESSFDFSSLSYSNLNSTSLTSLLCQLNLENLNNITSSSSYILSQLPLFLSSLLTYCYQQLKINKKLIKNEAKLILLNEKEAFNNTNSLFLTEKESVTTYFNNFIQFLTINIFKFNQLFVTYETLNSSTNLIEIWVEYLINLFESKEFNELNNDPLSSLHIAYTKLKNLTSISQYYQLNPITHCLINLHIGKIVLQNTKLLTQNNLMNLPLSEIQDKKHLNNIKESISDSKESGISNNEECYDKKKNFDLLKRIDEDCKDFLTISYNNNKKFSVEFLESPEFIEFSSNIIKNIVQFLQLILLKQFNFLMNLKNEKFQEDQNYNSIVKLLPNDKYYKINLKLLNSNVNNNIINLFFYYQNNFYNILNDKKLLTDLIKNSSQSSTSSSDISSTVLFNKEKVLIENYFNKKIIYYQKYLIDSYTKNLSNILTSNTISLNNSINIIKFHLSFLYNKNSLENCFISSSSVSSPSKSIVIFDNSLVSSSISSLSSSLLFNTELDLIKDKLQFANYYQENMNEYVVNSEYNIENPSLLSKIFDSKSTSNSQYFTVKHIDRLPLQDSYGLSKNFVINDITSSTSYILVVYLAFKFPSNVNTLSDYDGAIRLVLHVNDEVIIDNEQFNEHENKNEDEFYSLIQSNLMSISEYLQLFLLYPKEFYQKFLYNSLQSSLSNNPSNITETLSSSTIEQMISEKLNKRIKSKLNDIINTNNEELMNIKENYNKNLMLLTSTLSNNLLNNLPSSTSSGSGSSSTSASSSDENSPTVSTPSSTPSTPSSYTFTPKRLRQLQKMINKESYILFDPHPLTHESIYKVKEKDSTNYNGNIEFNDSNDLNNEIQLQKDNTSLKIIHPASLDYHISYQLLCIKALHLIRNLLNSEGQALIFKNFSNSSSYSIIYNGNILNWPSIGQNNFGTIGRLKNTDENLNNLSIIESVFSLRKTIYIPNLFNDPRYNPIIDGYYLINNKKKRKNLSIPLLLTPLRGISGSIIGIILSSPSSLAVSSSISSSTSSSSQSSSPSLPTTDAEVFVLENIANLISLALYWCQGAGEVQKELQKILHK